MKSSCLTALGLSICLTSLSLRAEDAPKSKLGPDDVGITAVLNVSEKVAQAEKAIKAMAPVDKKKVCADLFPTVSDALEKAIYDNPDKNSGRGAKINLFDSVMTTLMVEALDLKKADEMQGSLMGALMSQQYQEAYNTMRGTFYAAEDYCKGDTTEEKMKEAIDATRQVADAFAAYMLEFKTTAKAAIEEINAEKAKKKQEQPQAQPKP